MQNIIHPLNIYPEKLFTSKIMPRYESFISADEKSVYSAVYKMIKDRKVTSSNIAYLIGVIMEVVEKKWIGDKKSLAINILKEIVRTSAFIPEDQKDMLYSSIDFIAPAAIDLIVAGANGQLNINVQEVLDSCGCFGGSKQPPVQTLAKDLVKINIKNTKKK